jgi:methyltransferase
VTGFGWGLWLIVVIQRLGELIIARMNRKWAEEQGGFEVGKEHYPFIVFIHILFFGGILLEVGVLGATFPTWWWCPFTLFLLAQGLRLWCIKSLGRYWNTRIIIIPSHPPQVKGPYRYLRHPNYLVVFIELLTFPLVYGAWITSIVVSILNMCVLFFFRIPTEERALMETTSYGEFMGEKARFLPRR